MDTRQLAAFCEVVERRSFSEAASRLGVTQPAVSQQVRALEQRLGQQLLDRSGRRVEPTEAGLRLYSGAQRMLALEEQLLDELAEPDAPLRGTLELGASTGPAAIVLPLLLCEFQRANAGVAVSLSISDTQTVVDRVAERELELGVVGAARRHRGVVFEPFFRDEVATVHHAWLLVLLARVRCRRGRLDAARTTLAGGPVLTVEPLDAPLVAPAGADFMRFSPDPPDFSRGVRFNLHNNKWGTNFPMWCEGDLQARFVLTIGQ